MCFIVYKLMIVFCLIFINAICSWTFVLVLLTMFIAYLPAFAFNYNQWIQPKNKLVPMLELEPPWLPSKEMMPTRFQPSFVEVSAIFLHKTNSLPLNLSNHWFSGWVISLLVSGRVILRGCTLCIHACSHDTKKDLWSHSRSACTIPKLQWIASRMSRCWWKLRLKKIL